MPCFGPGSCSPCPLCVYADSFLLLLHALSSRAVWHQADPITKGTRWALVIFYKVEKEAC